jgi:hypothetical protein
VLIPQTSRHEVGRNCGAPESEETRDAAILARPVGRRLTEALGRERIGR